MSSFNAQFLQHSAILQTRLSIALIEKAGLTIHKGWIVHKSIPNWEALTPDEQELILTLAHEREHYSDMTGTPTGMILWRLERLRLLAKLGLLRELKRNGLLAEATLPLTDWLENKGGWKIFETRKTFNDEQAEYLPKDWLSIQTLKLWHHDEKKLLEKWLEDFLHNNDPGRTAADIAMYNAVFRIICKEFHSETKVQWKEAGSTDKMIPADSEFALTTFEILETRAYLEEFWSIFEYRSEKQHEWWLERIPYPRVRALFKVFISGSWQEDSIYMMTAIALCPALDPISWKSKKSHTMRFDDYHPALRWRKICYALENGEGWRCDNMALFELGVGDHIEDLEPRVHWAELAEKLFGNNAPPYSLAAGARQPVMPNASYQKVNEGWSFSHYDASKFDLWAAVLTGYQSKFMSSKVHLAGLTDAFRFNHFGISTVFLDFAEQSMKYFPYCEIFKEGFRFKDHRQENLDKKHELVQNHALADMLSTVTDVAEQMFVDALFSGSSQCWDFDLILKNSQLSALIHQEQPIKTYLAKTYAKELVDQIIWTLPPL